MGGIAENGGTVATAEANLMRKELGLLNVVCIVIAVLFLGLAVLNALTSPELLTTDNLFVTMVCLVMALVFAVNPLLYLKSEGRLPIPFQKRLPRSQSTPAITGAANRPALLDAKGRPVPPDVRQIAAKFGQTPTKET